MYTTSYIVLKNNVNAALKGTLPGNTFNIVWKEIPHNSTCIAK